MTNSLTTFLDAEGDAWFLRLDVNTIRRVRSTQRVDLARTFTDARSLEQLFGDVVQLVDVLYEIVRPQADARGIGAQAFGERMVGDTLDRAVTALEEAYIESVPQSRRRELLRRLIAGMKAAQSQAALRIENALDGMILTAIEEQNAQLDAILKRPQPTPTQPTPAPVSGL